MATIQQSIEVGVPVHTAYHQLTQFEHYPRFMQYVEAVQQLDDTHLHWTTTQPHQSLEWDSEITEQLPDRCIAWRNLSGPASSGKVELQPTGADSVRVTLIMECDPLQFAPVQDGNADTELERRIGQDLVRFKKMIETPGLHADMNATPSADTTAPARQAAAESSGATVGKIIGQTAAEQRDVSRSSGSAASASHAAPIPAASYAAGAEGWSGDEDPLQPVISAALNLAQPPAASSAAAEGESALSPNSLSQPSAHRETEGQLNVAEEQNFDQQSAQARQVGQLPPVSGSGNPNPADALAQALQPEPAHDGQRQKPAPRK